MKIKEIGILLGIVGALFLSACGQMDEGEGGGGPPTMAPPPPPPVVTMREGDPSPPSMLDRFRASMRDANIAFNTPDKMVMGESKQVELALSLHKSIEALKKEVAQDLPSEGAQVKIGSIMEARLVGGSAFGIASIAPERQAVSESETTKWSWEVTPKEKGSHRLHLTLSAVVVLEGVETNTSIKTFDRDIDVQVTVPGAVVIFLRDNVQWIWLVFVVPILAILRIAMKKKKDPADEML